MAALIINIGGMHCVMCASSVEKALTNTKGVNSVSVSYATEKARIEYDSSIISYKQICKIIKKTGYYVIEGNNKDKSFKVTLCAFLLSVFFSIPFFIMMILMLVAPNSSLSNFFHNGIFQVLFATPIQFIVGYKFYQGAYKSIKNKSPNMDLLVALGTSIAYFFSLYNLIKGINVYYFESSVFIITLVYLGKLLEMNSKNKATAAVSSLIKLRPSKVIVIRDNEKIEVDVEELVEGDVFIVGVGENIATDGVILKGTTNVDESMITGESLPKYKSTNDEVIGGTINIDGVIEVKASKVGENSTLFKIIRLVEQAESSKAKVQRLVDKVSSIFVPTIIIIAVLAFIINYIIIKDFSISITRSVAVLVIACPCSLGLATPTALIVGLGKAAKNGILIKNADTLENIGKLKTIVLDKTGTITKGELEVVNVEIFNFNKEEFSQIISKIEEYSKHPIAKAIVNCFGESDIKLDLIKEISGKGIEAIYNGKSIKVGSYNWLKKYVNYKKENMSKISTFMVINEEFVGAVYLKDGIKENSLNAINKLKNSNMKIVLASGDNKVVCEDIAESVGINEVYYEVLPADKHKIINKYKEIGIVAMVGDGINDAPALASADVGISMGSGVDVALQTSDLVIMNNDLNSIYSAYIISKATMRKIKQNLFWAFFYNCIGIPLAFCGLLSPIIAGLCMSLSSISVVTNSLLLNKVKV